MTPKPEGLTLPLRADEAMALARVLRELSILREGQVLHIGGYTIGPLKKLPRKRKEEAYER